MYLKAKPQNSSAVKVSEHIPSGFSMFVISAFRSIEYKYDEYRGKDNMKRFCEFLRDHAMKIINFKKKKIKLLTKKQQESYEIIFPLQSVIFAKESLTINMWKIKNIVNLEIIVIIQGYIEELCIANKI